MGGRSSKSGAGGAGGGAGVAVVTAGVPAALPPTPPPPVFSDTDSAPYHQLYNGRGYYAKQNFDAATQNAITTYLQADAVPGSYYSPSQILNHSLRQGLALSPTEATMAADLDRGMHNLGYNVNLTRYDRAGFLQGLGITTNPANLTTAGLQRLVGSTYTDKGFVSTSYNDFKNAPVGNCFTDKLVKINIQAPAKTQALMPGNGPGGSLGEIILGRNQNYRITGARVVNGVTTRSQATYYNRRIEIDVEVI